MSHTSPPADPFATLTSDRGTQFTPSPVRSVWEFAASPGVISLAGGNPDVSRLPHAALGSAAERLIRDLGGTVLQYGSGDGTPELREQIAKLVSRNGISASPADILITPGSQMSLGLIAMLYCQRGDVVLAETPTYSGAIAAFRALEAEVQHVECDADGLIPEALERRIAELRAKGRPIKMLYTIPNFGNPSGVSLSAARRPEVARICAEAGVMVVEDDPYGLVRFAGEAAPAIRAHDPNVIYLGSMSKIFSPGLRVGWIIAPPHVRARLQIVSETMLLHPPLLNQRLAAEYLGEMP